MISFKWKKWFCYQGYACVIKIYDVVLYTLEELMSVIFFLKCLEFIIKVIWDEIFFEILNNGFSFFGYRAIWEICWFHPNYQIYWHNLLLSLRCVESVMFIFCIFCKFFLITPNSFSILSFQKTNIWLLILCIIHLISISLIY